MAFALKDTPSDKVSREKSVYARRDRIHFDFFSLNCPCREILRNIAYIAIPSHVRTLVTDRAIN